MYSIKPGRGPSTLGCFGAIIVAVFGIFWTAAAASMGAPGFLVAFGVVFVLIAIAQGIYNLYNATADNRVSELDIVRSSEEPDPFARRGPDSNTSSAPVKDAIGSFCPYCGNALSSEFAFCPKCGKAVRPAT